MPEVAAFWRQVVTINDYQRDRFARQIVTAMFNTVVGKRICILGFAFKANTGDTRESAAIGVCRALAEEQAELVVTDPQALDNARKDLGDLGDRVRFVKDPYEAARDAHAVAILTEWPLYRDLDYQRVFAAMEKPAFLFDGRHLVDPEAMFEIGFNVYSLGRPPLTRL